ncbi:hypothetical protein AVEN_55815-1 [Araneus ventricosus]|uniref:Uncharacterized protein n=1 Tax=Araneus ventricosus TaxID=182803 RepID=A0A4Y2CP76_ARAVE|nr:hypothetical protein AVEN_55815-1 [Araneus ventricosus]
MPNEKSTRTRQERRHRLSAEASNHIVRFAHSSIRIGFVNMHSGDDGPPYGPYSASNHRSTEARLRRFPEPRRLFSSSPPKSGDDMNWTLQTRISLYYTCSCYNLPLRHFGNGLWLARIVDPPYCTYLRIYLRNSPLKSQPPQAGLRRL